MIQETVDRKDLSTSSSTIEGECPEERMIRKTKAATVRQDVQEVRTPSLSVSSDMLTRLFGLSGPTHPPKVKYSLKLLLWLALSARMCVLACQDQHTLPKWNNSLKLLLWLALSARMCVLACQDQHTLPKWNISKLVHCREIKRYKNTPAHLKLSVFSGSRNWRRIRRWWNRNIAKWGGAQGPKMWRNSTERVQPQERTRRWQLNLNWSLQRKSPQRR